MKTTQETNTNTEVNQMQTNTEIEQINKANEANEKEFFGMVFILLLIPFITTIFNLSDLDHAIIFANTCAAELAIYQFFLCRSMTMVKITFFISIVVSSIVCLPFSSIIQ